jgi:hypothetical protein
MIYQLISLNQKLASCELNMAYMCPVCGYPGLDKPAYINGIGSFEICPSCRFQFEVTDADRGIPHDQWRKQWIEGGMIWDKGKSQPPKGWDPRKQLQNVVN